MKIAIVGSRYYNDYNKFCFIIKKVFNRCDKIKDNNITIVSGGARGADTLAERFAKDNNYKMIVHKPDWTKYKKGAGPKRNTKIVNELNKDIDILIAFIAKNSVGTLDTLNKAKKANIKIYTHHIK